MKRLSFLIVAFLLAFGLASYAQNMVYFVNGNVVSDAQLAEAAFDKLKLNVNRGASVVKYPHPRNKVALAFNANGNYLAISELAEDNAAAQQQINDFVNAPARTVSYDIIITRDSKVIKAKISYESDDAANYQTLAGEAASVNKKDVVAIIYEDGRHQMVSPVEEIAPLLAAVHNSVKDAEVAPPTPATPVAVQNEPAPAPNPEPAATNTEPAVANAEPATKPAKAGKKSKAPKVKPVLNEEEYNSYSRKAIQKVEEFGNYLSVIVDKTKDSDEKDKAIEQAAKLFMANATIEVNSINKPGTTSKYKVLDYLTRLKLLPYSSTKIEWTDIQYVSELKQEADGNYYGLIKGQQSFIGYSEDGKEAVYSDVTQKNVRVKLQSYQKLIEGVEQANWEVLLGNVGVAVNK